VNAAAETGLRLMHRAGLLRLGRLRASRSLTVLTYHRVADATELGSATFRPNVSASPEMFDRQMAYLCRHFSVVGLETVLAWLRGKSTLPPRPAMITFDDGYLDNLTHALPILRSHECPATLFLTTDYVGEGEPFYWDLAAHRFDRKQTDTALRKWVEELKGMRPDERRAALGDVTGEEFAPTHLTWDDVREMMASGITVGAHTCSHTILTRLTPEEMKREIDDSIAAIRDATGTDVHAFAYPNGLKGDFNATTKALLAETGIRLAFTMLRGPARLSEVKARPLAVRRLHISQEDTPPRFAAKVMGWGRGLR